MRGIGDENMRYLLYSRPILKDLCHGQTRLIRKLSIENKIKFNSVDNILMKNKGNQREQISFNKDKIVNVLSFDLILS